MEALHPLGARQHRAEVGRDLLDSRQERRLPVAPGGHEFVVHQVGGDQDGAVARGKGEGAFALTDVEPDMVKRDALPIAPYVALHDGLAQGFTGVGTARDDRVRPIRAYHEAGPFDMPRAVLARGNDAGDPAVILNQIDDAHAVTKLRAGSHRRRCEYAVQQIATGP